LPQAEQTSYGILHAMLTAKSEPLASFSSSLSAIRPPFLSAASLVPFKPQTNSIRRIGSW
jgi:hypothetical protein